MKIAVDIQSAIAQKAGVGRYTRELVEQMAGLLKPSEHLVLNYFDFRRQAERLSIPGAKERRIGWIPGRMVQGAWRSFRFPPYNWLTGRADLFHFPNFIIPPLSRGKAVVTLHDIAFMRFPQFAENRNVDYLNQYLPKTVQRADAIITISNFSAQEITTFLNVPRERVHAIPLGISETFKAPHNETCAQALAALKLHRPYLLTVGTLEPRKNIPHLIRVFESLDAFDGDLVIVGGYGWKYAPIVQRIRNSPKADRIHCIGYVDDQTLPALYAQATAFVMTSFYEGFGFPPLEAMACGTPVVSSTGGSLKEVLGDGALLLDHFEIDGWQAALHKVIQDSALRKELTEKGLKVSAQYTWHETAQRTLDVYRQVVAG